MEYIKVKRENITDTKVPIVKAEYYVYNKNRAYLNVHFAQKSDIIQIKR